MDLNKHVVKNKNNCTIHSSGFARIANKGRIGSISSVTFNQRQNINKNRQLVNSYRSSKIGLSRGVLKAKSYNRDGDSVDNNNRSIRNNLQDHNSKTANIQRHFSEPTSRTYNPYS